MNEGYFKAELYFQGGRQKMSSDPPFEEELFVWEAYKDSNSASSYYHVRTLLGETSSDPRLFRFSS